jgi:hypothetical protein
MRTLGIIGCLVVSNYSYQWLWCAIPDWSAAFDRSYFQSAAIILFIFVQWAAKAEEA